jgi:hypothetical protein
VYDLLKNPTGIEFGQRCGSLGDGISDRVGLRVFNNLLSQGDDKVFLGGRMVHRIAEEATTTSSTKEKVFGGPEGKHSISDQKSTINISGVTKPNSKKFRKFLENRC